MLFKTEANFFVSFLLLLCIRLRLLLWARLRVLLLFVNAYRGRVAAIHLAFLRATISCVLTAHMFRVECVAVYVGDAVSRSPVRSSVIIIIIANLPTCVLNLNRANGVEMRAVRWAINRNENKNKIRV